MPHCRPKQKSKEYRQWKQLKVLLIIISIIIFNIYMAQMSEMNIIIIHKMKLTRDNCEINTYIKGGYFGVPTGPHYYRRKLAKIQSIQDKLIPQIKMLKQTCRVLGSHFVNQAKMPQITMLLRDPIHYNMSAFLNIPQLGKIFRNAFHSPSSP